jgi:hypothetical protein
MIDRFDFQRGQVRKALLELDGVALNVGANEDPANIKSIDRERVVNCDLCEHDDVLDRPNRVDVLFDCARDRWPFEDQAAAVVLLGDILEHLTPGEQIVTLTEAKRVGKRLVVTVPCDERPLNNDDYADTFPRGAVHRSIVTEPKLRLVLADTGWRIVSFAQADYGFVPVGFFVVAE